MIYRILETKNKRFNIMSKISVIVTLYKTPEKMLKNLNAYKEFKLNIFEQEGNQKKKKNLECLLNFKFAYFSDYKNIGLAKSSNYLLSKIKTDYCLFTQSDVVIKKKEILRLKKIFDLNKNIIFVTPNFSKNKKKKRIEFTKKINAACIMIDMKKVKKVGLFDEDYFLYWEDIQLMEKINNSKFKMVVANNIFANHLVSKSTVKNRKIDFIRNMNFIYGELVFDYKQKKLRFIKIFRKFIQNFILFIFNIIFFQLNNVYISLSKIFGILKFIKFYLKKLYSI